jgi:hypothetical protein
VAQTSISASSCEDWNKTEIDQERWKVTKEIKKQKKEFEDRSLLECFLDRHRRFGTTCCPHVQIRTERLQLQPVVPAVYTSHPAVNSATFTSAVAQCSCRVQFTSRSQQCNIDISCRSMFLPFSILIEQSTVQLLHKLSLNVPAVYTSHPTVNSATFT